MKICSRLDLLRLFVWLIILCAAASPCSARAQVPGSVTSQPNTSATTQSGQSVTLNGVVLNANTNQPVAHVLVQVGSYAILTEHDGKFQFTDTSGTSELLRATKPGFYDSLDQNSSSTRITFGSTADPVKVYLYPEALLTGIVTAPNGDPLTNIRLQALRKAGDESGSAWMMAGQTSTNSDGQFRLPLSAGDYVLESHYLSNRPLRQQAVLPMVVPDPANGSESSAEPTIHLDSGTEQHLDLRPQVRFTHDVHIQIDGASNQGFPQIEAHLPNGLSFLAPSRQSGMSGNGTSGEFVTTLPTGSYVLTMSTGEREGSSYAQANVTVGDTDVTGVLLHMTRSLPTQVEVLIDSSSASTTSDNQPPSVQQLGLRFVRSDAIATVTNQNIYLRGTRAETTTFTLPPGKYRLLAQPLSQWFIESATLGGTDLLTQDLDVEADGTSAPLRIVVSSHTAGLKGTVKLDGSPAGNSWVYFIPASAGVTPVIFAVSENDGSFSRPSIPPGSYRAVAFETHHPVDFTNAATLDRLAPYMKSVTVAAGETATLDLDAISTLELKR